jgi:ribosomal protein S6--L-glutamate ligase
MKLTVLSSGAGWHVQDLCRAAAARGIAVDLADFRAVHSGTADCRADAVIVRTMPAGSLEQIVFRMDVLHALAGRGTAVWNPPRALECCIDKYLTTTRLEKAGVPTPRTWCGQVADEAGEAFERLGGDVVIKPLFGAEGRGIVRVSDCETAWRVCHAVVQSGGVIYMQEYVRHPGHDVRVFVLGERVVASMRRFAVRGWRTNVAQGGRAEAMAPDAAVERLALAAARAAGCPIAGVDLLAGPVGWQVLEVNAVPGWRALARACGVDVAATVIDFIREGGRP